MKKFSVVIILLLIVFVIILTISPLMYTITKTPVPHDSTMITREVISNDYYIIMNDNTGMIRIKCSKEQYAAIDDLKPGINYFIYQTNIITGKSKLLAINEDGQW